LSLSSKAFIENIQDKLHFLEQCGYKKESPNCFRDETTINYISTNLMITFCHSSYSDEFWCVIGKPNKGYPKNPVGLFKLIEALPNEPELPKSAIEAISKTAELMKNQLSELINGNLSLISEVWAQEELNELDIYNYQKEVALHSEIIGDSEILEIPNTKKALGSSYMERFPHHDFEQKTTWIVITKIAEFNCNSYEQAQEMAMQFK
jgi:hypothetical protein